MRIHTRARRAAAVLTLLLPLGAAACGSRTQAAAVATAGAAAATAATLTDQNAEGEVLAPIAEADRRARAVLATLGLQVSKSATENAGTEIEHEARSGDRVVHVKLEAPAGATRTKVSVSSRRGTTIDYDVSHAREILQRIQRQQ